MSAPPPRADANGASTDECPLVVLQVALALLSLAKVGAMGALSRGGWGALGVFEILCTVLLVVPAATNWIRARREHVVWG